MYAKGRSDLQAGGCGRPDAVRLGAEPGRERGAVHVVCRHVTADSIQNGEAYHSRDETRCRQTDGGITGDFGDYRVIAEIEEGPGKFGALFNRTLPGTRPPAPVVS